MLNPCLIIGVLDNGSEGLTGQVLSELMQADLVIAAGRTLQLFADRISAAEIKDLTGAISQVPEWIETAIRQQKKVVVLATGDPLCHGIAHYLVKKLGAEKCCIYPNTSTIQLACSRFCVSWQDLKICSVHSRDAGEWMPGSGPEHGMYALLQDIDQHDKLAILTSPENNPARIARMLITEKMDKQFEMRVAQDLLKPEEKLFEGMTLNELAENDFNGNDVVLLIRIQDAQSYPLFGMADKLFRQRKPDKGLITKREVRALSLARMQLKNHSVVWDIGAGSGSVGIEAARLCRQGHVYAVEKNDADFAIAAENAVESGLRNYTLIHAKAPDGLADWQDPNAVFVGGSGGELSVLIEYCLQRLTDGGWLVMNFVTLENLNTAVESLKSCQADWDVTLLQAARSQPILQMNRMQAENPVWIVSVEKRGA